MSGKMRWLGLGVAALWLWGCDGGQPSGELFAGQTDFVNEEPSANDQRNYGEPGMLEDGAVAAPTADPNEAPQGREGEVEEADIYRVDNDRLFYLNTYRGFIIYDLKDPKKPSVISRLPIYGYPIEMFVSGTTVYALLRDALYLTQAKDKLEFKRHNVSQLIAIDISDLKNPKVLKKVDIIGQLREGVSRKIEDTIYVVSYVPQHYYWGWSYNQSQDDEEQAWVYSFNVADPKAPQLVDQLQIFKGGSYETEDPITGATTRRYFQQVAISATSNSLMVVENWRKYGYVPGSDYRCSNYTSLQQAIVSIVDISDPKGAIRVHTRFETYGSLTDQFKQTYFFDDVTKKGTYIGIFARREWSRLDCEGESFIQNAIESWDVSDGENPKRVSRLAFGKENETVRGSTFDRERRVAYAITARNIDPLYAISFADPENLQIRSEIDGLSGDMNVFRLIGDDKFLLGIGRDNSDVCDGFTDRDTGWSTNVAVSIIDVRDLDKIRLVQRQCVAVKDAAWVSSALNWNLDQAHKMIGMHSDGRTNVITVPVYYYKKSTESDWGWWWYERETAVGMMTWDLSKYDDTKDATQQEVLQNFGTLIHPHGQVRRSIVTTHQTTQRRMVINLSDTHLSVFDVEDLNNPVQQSIVEVAPYIQALYRFGDYMVEHVGPRSYYSYGSDQQEKSEFRIKRAGGDLEGQAVLSSFAVGGVHQVIRQGNNLVMFRSIYNYDANDASERYETHVLIYDLSNPLQPKRAGELRVVGRLAPYYSFYCGEAMFWGGYWFGSQNNWTVVKDGVVFLTYDYDYQTHQSTRKLQFLDLSKNWQPALRDYGLTASSNWHFLGVVPDNTDKSAFYLNYRTLLSKRTSADGQEVYRYRYYAQQYTAAPGSLTPGVAINVPGKLIRAFADSHGDKLLLTQDNFYESLTFDGRETTRSNFRLNLLRSTQVLGQPAAMLLDSRVFSSFQLRDLVLSGERLVINARRDWFYLQENELDWTDQSDHLMVFDLSGHQLKETYSAPTGTYQVNLMGTHKGRLFVNLPGDGVLVVNMDDPTRMVGEKFLRTLGWSTHLEFAGDDLYVASGYFGTFHLDLGQSVVAIPTS
ncbi:MAG: beta-propeller domain-containing protein [Deltaproteobacteria bacterium]|nr:beta-propeller domain-containing protein [Deltaproteobacteria bacterium]